MEISINTPALLFPAITFLMLVYSNRFLALSGLIRNLHERYTKEEASRPIIIKQITNLRTRLSMIRTMQGLGVISFLLCMVCMYMIYLGHQGPTRWLFATSMVCLMISLVLSFLEISISTKALEHELSDMEELKDVNMVRDYFKTQFHQE
jgi:type IV secretory pathway VirB6-like protein